MTPEEFQEALESLGLVETERGFQLTARGLQKGTQRAHALAKRGDRECAAILALGADHPRRAELALHVQIDLFSRSGI
ncbi:hypothetical protein ABZX62_20395 [Streptomyces flavidovirens]|uniref:hypothetical protein n=1 Tax=Streptomyces flavidovirens TaxID=67298 RepID=UPI0033B4778F